MLKSSRHAKIHNLTGDGGVLPKNYETSVKFLKCFRVSRLCRRASLGFSQSCTEFELLLLSSKMVLRLLES